MMFRAAALVYTSYAAFSRFRSNFDFTAQRGTLHAWSV
jgi:hypothetical protein